MPILGGYQMYTCADMSKLNGILKWKTGPKHWLQRPALWPLLSLGLT
jgi:hypothetical protein